MTIRPYTREDGATLAKLFYETVHAVCARDYTPAQLAAWAKDERSLLTRREDLERQHTLLAEIGGVIVGFGSIDVGGYLDLLFVHKDCQRKGIATALCDALEKDFAVITTHASITAKPFFERRGFTAVCAREVERDGVILKNFAMEKRKPFV